MAKKKHHLLNPGEDPEEVYVGDGEIEKITIKAPYFKGAIFELEGTEPLVIHNFCQKALLDYIRQQELGDAGKNTNRKKAPKDFKALYAGAFHRSEEGWAGICSNAYRNSMISACRVAGYAMTKAKLSLFPVHEGRDHESEVGLIKIIGRPKETRMMVRLPTSGKIDVACRPMWKQWKLKLHLNWDAHQFKTNDVANLLAIAGMQVGVGEGRPDSPKSNGMGWGLWRVKLVETNE